MIVFDIPLLVPFRGVTRRQGILFEGEAGWAEWSPFREYGDEEAASWLRASVAAAREGHPEPLRDRVAVNGIIPAIGPGEVARRAAESGCRTLKVKVAAPGEGIDDDVARVAAARAALPGGAIRVDANGAWTPDRAEDAIRELAQFGLEYVEQPCASAEELAELRRRLDGMVAIAADESIRRAADPLRVRDLGAADVVVLKVQPLGGAAACLDLAERLGLPVVVSSAVETSVGLEAGLRLAAALPELPFACGLETGRLLARDVTVHPLLPAAGQIEVRPARVDADLLAACRADARTERWWLDRLHRVAAAAGVELP
ncbi:o-succinylbenzoate synthase [Arachnia propionica]|uniref:o-succinylbenzoate synthase n=1 Tax=Arachnia propionica TaxID=1750 RepID=UPI000F701DCA|nr:o-succinylbenzoate synthase [Arachnia propionica]VEJ59428.1 L-Ala-D/L-Glu epimerase [Arachnia propionica]